MFTVAMELVEGLFRAEFWADMNALAIPSAKHGKSY
jgi:hypothetical protein